MEQARSTVVDEVLPKVSEAAAGVAAAGVAASKKFADEASSRGPEAFAALKDDHDTDAALAALKGEKPKKKGRKRLLLLALAIGGVVAYVVSKQSKPKKDPWAVPAGDPYRAPSSPAGLDGATAGAAGAAASDAPVEEAADSAVEVASTDAPSDLGQVPEGADVEATSAEDASDLGAGGTPEAPAGDAWSTARDWADDSAVPSTTATSEDADLSIEHLGDETGETEDGEDKA